MRPNERRAAIFDALCIRRHDTVENLASEFGVSEKTIRRDIEELSCSYPIETVRDMRLDVFDVLVGINLLREGLVPPKPEDALAGTGRTSKKAGPLFGRR